MPQHSAGLLLYRRRDGETQVLLAHFGGPYWAKKDEGAWAIPKGLIEEGESAEQTARREFAEEVGPVPDGPLLALGDVRQKGGKLVTAFALEADFDPEALASTSFAIEWPPRSGQMQSFPEVDRVAWFGPAEAQAKILPSQRPILDALAALIAG
ncbi:NUDIX domain-containing protein [Sphingosinicella sp. YJ22]|uniref:NUDIX domain-containing protein n=1 Tax=Sphingosinicella sp. YJ22 TaxID=1104780 RepID=UPI001407DF4C|nr:NUDIX domain-containing protein [Sphingosinicella sp. YJ22]